MKLAKTICVVVLFIGLLVYSVGNTDCHMPIIEYIMMWLMCAAAFFASLVSIDDYIEWRRRNRDD